MSYLRALIRGSLLVALTLSHYGLLLLVAPLGRFAPGRRLRLRNAVFRSWARAFRRIVGMRVTISGRPPEGAFFLVANHVSYMDVILLALAVDAAFVAKADLRRWPVLGRIFAAGDTIFIDRGRKRDLLRVMERIRHYQQLGLGTIVFPEGTSGRGDVLLPFKPSLLQFAAGGERAVSYACIRYVTPEGRPPAQEVVCWWGDAPFVPHAFQLLRLPSFDAHLAFGNGELHDRDRKALAGHLRGAMLELFEPCS